MSTYNEYWTALGNIQFKNDFLDNVQFNQRVTFVMTQLREKSLDNVTVVALFMKRSDWTLVFMFALLRMGIPFAPIDITLPDSRWYYMLKDLNVELIITEDQYATLLEDKKPMGCMVLTCDQLKANYQKASEFMQKEQKLSVDERSQNNEMNHGVSKEMTLHEPVAYYLYTSGSTGYPKAVEVPQCAVKNFIEAVPMQVPLTKGQKIACITSMSFDIFFLESLVALKIGLNVILASEEERKNPWQLMKLLIQEEVEVLQITPSHLSLLERLDTAFTFLKTIKCLMVGGEAFPYNLLKNLQMNANCRIFNMYGPTETTIWSSVAELTAETEVHIGTPLLNTDFYILNEFSNLAESGTTGELCISGMGLANGYKNQEVLTEEKFIVPSFNDQLRLYRTGDMVCYKQGKYYCLGRKDNQVKYNGHRIELEEIEAACRNVDGVMGAVAYLVNVEEPYLAVIYEGDISNEIVRKEMTSQLASYMMPKVLIMTDELLLTNNGKVDRKGNYTRFLEDKKECERVSAEKENSNTVEMKVIEIIKQVAPNSVPNISTDTTLEQMGINSLDFVTIVVEFEDVFHIRFKDEMLFMKNFFCIKDFVDYISSEQKDS